MANRKIKDAKDLATNELIYFKGHAKATYMSDGRNVEDAINQIGTGGGGGITVETDPVFSASPAASITDAKKAEWDGKYTKPNGGIPASDLTTGVQDSLGKADSALQTSQYGEHTCIEVSAFSDPISGLIYALPDAATGDEDLVLAGASRLDDYTLVRCGGIWDRDGISYVLPSEANGNEDDILVTRDTLKTINGQSIFGDGNIVIEGGGGSSSGTKEIVTVLGGLIDEIEPNKIYLVDTNGDDVEIQSIYVPIDDSYAEFTVIIDFNSHSAGGDGVAPTIILPSEIKWANGSIPDLQGYTSCELSIVYYRTSLSDGYHAVLTPFKNIE